MGPDREGANDPSNVPKTIEAMAKIKGVDVCEVRQQIHLNFQKVFRDGEIVDKYLQNRELQQQELSRGKKCFFKTPTTNVVVGVGDTVVDTM